MNVRLPASSNPRSSGRYLPVRFPADALAAAQSVARGVQNIGAAAIDVSQAANRMRLETERRQEQADKLGGINSLDEWHATFGASLLADQNPLGYEKRFNQESESKIQEILAGIPEERRGNLEESLRDRQSNYRVNTISQAAIMANRYATRNFEAAYKLADEKNDYEGIRFIIDSNPFTTSEEKNLMHEATNKKQTIYQCDSLLVKDPTGLFDKLEDGSLDEYLSPLEQEGYRRKLRSMDDDGRDRFVKSFTLVPKSVSEGGSSKKKDDTPEFTGLFTEEECGWINAIRNGRWGEVREQVATRAIVEARAFKPGDPNSPGMEIARDQFIRKYELFGLEKEFLTRQWGVAEVANKKLFNPTVDVGKIVNGIGEKNLLKNEEEYMRSYQLVRGNNIGGWGKNGIMRERYRELAGITDKDNANQAAQKFLDKETERIRNDIKARVSNGFFVWRDSTEDGQKASSVEQYEKIHSLVREATGDSSLMFSNRGGEIDESISAARIAQNNKYTEFVRSRGKDVYIDTRDRSERLQEVSLGYDVSRKDLPEGVLLPKAMMEGFDQENGVVEVTFDNKRFRRFRVVGECEGDVPKMTYEVARQGAYKKDSLYDVKMRVRGGNMKEMMQEQDEASKGMNIMRDGNLNNPQSLKFKASAGLKPYIGDFVEAGKKFGVNPALLLSIAEHETGRGTSNAFLKKNNAMGVSPNGGGPRSFASVKESIDYMAQRLKKYYIDEGRTDIASIGAKYAPIGAGNDPRGLNNSWINGVSKYYEQFNS